MKCLLLLAQLAIVLLTLGSSIPLAKGAKILVLLPIASKSQKIVFDPLIKALALHGHDVTVVSPVPSRGMPISVKEIHPVTVQELGYALSGSGADLLETRRALKLTNRFVPVFWNTSLVDNGCHRLYNDVEIKYLMKGMKKFDLAIVNGLHNECALGLVYYFRVPHLYLTTSAAPNFVIGRFGHYFPTSFTPSPYTSFGTSMSFPERTVNFLVETVLLFVAKFYLYPHYEQIYKSYVGFDAPGIDEIDDNVGVVLMNSHYAMSNPRPLLPNIIEIGGLHCHPPRPLPTEFEKFLSEANHGFIYFSLGSVLQARDVPNAVIEIFINVFTKLDQRVIWKWDQDIPNLPTNLMTGHFLPEQDILGHRNIRLFISNGGLLSTQAAIYHGVPMIGIPLDDILNMEQAEKAGYALTWEILDMNQTALQDVIDRMLDEPQFKARAKQLSKMYRDMPGVSLEKALFWTEYVIRNKGAPHLRAASKDLNYFQYNSIDVILFLMCVILIVFYALYYLISCVCVKKTPCSPLSVEERNGCKNKCD